MSEYLRTPMGAEDPPPPEVVTLEHVSDQLSEILRRQAEEESRRKWTLLFTVGGALFAAVKLGIVAIPHFRKSRGLHAIATNPSRRRRR